MDRQGVALAAKLLELLSVWNPQTVEDAREWIRASTTGTNRETLMAMLNAIDGSVSTRPTQPQPGASRPPRETTAADSSPEVKEFTAILADTEFVDRQGLLIVLEDLFGDDFVRAGDHKRSRAELVAKGTRRFLSLPPEQRDKTFTLIRRRYLRDRKSTLSGWSTVIAGGK